MITAHDLRLTIEAAPTLWMGRIGETGSIAIHFRYGYLSVHVSHASDDRYGKGSELVFEAIIDEDENSIGRQGDSCIGEARMKEALRQICCFT